MGALAITTLAGAHLLRDAGPWPLVRAMAPFLTGCTLVFWAMASWWIPLLLILGVWRHLGRRVPLNYSADYWSLVFPLGMYSTATLRLAEVIDLSALRIVSTVFLYAVFVAWAATCFGLVRALGRIIWIRRNSSTFPAPARGG